MSRGKRKGRILNFLKVGINIAWKTAPDMFAIYIFLNIFSSVFLASVTYVTQEMLAGNWSGSYSTAQRRHGLIDFRLDAAAGAAYGDVFMIADHATEPYTNSAAFRVETRVQSGRTVADAADPVRPDRGRSGAGLVDRLWDPDRHCQAVATFTGSVRDGSVRESTTMTARSSPSAPTAG